MPSPYVPWSLHYYNRGGVPNTYEGNDTVKQNLLCCCSPDPAKSKDFLACLERCMRVAAHLLAGLQVLMLWTHLQMALAEGSVEHDSRLNGQQIPQKVQALQQGTTVNQRPVRWACVASKSPMHRWHLRVPFAVDVGNHMHCTTMDEVKVQLSCSCEYLLTRQ